MSRIRDIANLFSAGTDAATDAEVTAAISAHNTSANGHVKRGNTASRPASPANGDIYMNTQLGYPEFYDGTNWTPVGVKPTAPSSVVATNQGSGRAFNNGQASVAFTTGTIPGSTYTVTSSPGSYFNTGSSSPILVTGLQSNTSYTFTATASNVYGTSDASSASSSITATTVPQAPTIGTATSGNAQASVSFTANATGGSSITGFTVTSSPGNITASGASSPITVTGLTNGTTYTFTVTATNSNGTSSASSASNSITPQAALFIGTFGPVSDSNTIATSPDGITWTKRSNPNGGNAYTSRSQSITKFNGNYIITGAASTGGYIKSTNGTSWSTGASLTGVVNANATTNALMLSGSVGAYPGTPILYTTTDLSTHTNRTSALPASFLAVYMSGANGANEYWLTDTDGKWAYSTDLSTWTLGSGNVGAGSYTAKFGTYYYAACNGGELFYKTTLSGSWTKATSNTTEQLRGMAWDGANKWVITTNNAKVITSTDGVNWTSSSTGASAYYALGIAYGNGLFVYNGSDGVIYTSPNGTTWTQRTSGYSAGEYGWAMFYG